MRCLLDRILCFCFFTGLACLASSGSATAIPSGPDYVVSLDGTWRFKLEQESECKERESFRKGAQPIVVPDHPEPFHRLDYKEDSTWHDLNVPGNWEMAGYSPATYDQPDNAVGLYRLSFELPARWKGRSVLINFDGVQNGAEVYLNGRPVTVDECSWGRGNYHEGGFTAFQVDLTPAVKFGGKNLLAVRVTKNTRSVDLDTGDYFLLGGIYRTVTLFSVPATHIKDYAVRTKLRDNSKAAEVHVLVDVTTPALGSRVSMQLEGQPATEAIPDSDGHAEFVQVIENPKLWSSEHPNLYKLDLELRNEAGQRTEHLSRHAGLREVSIKNGIFMVNNVPVKLTGMCRHDHCPTLGSALNDEVWRKDIMMIKAANGNAIRTSHYPYGSRFYDLCDELGMYVADEVAACWCSTSNAELAPAFAQHARETVRRDRNHPSVVIWAVGNENKPGPNNRIAAEEIRKLDPTVPRLISCKKAEESGVEFDDLHYVTPEKIQKANSEPRRSRIPMIYLENPNSWEIRNGADYGCTDLWAAVIDRTWREVWQDDHVPGTFHWEWADRAVADKCPTKLYDYFPRTGINLVKVKGICDGFRNPRAWYYHMKMAQAPVRVDLEPRIVDGAVIVKVKNEYSFTDLAELKTTWHLLKRGRRLAKASTHLALAPRTNGELRLSLPASALAAADTLRLDFDLPDGVNVATYQLSLRPEVERNLELNSKELSHISFPRLNLTAVDWGRNDIEWRWAYRHAGRLVNISVQRDDSSSSKIANEALLCSTPLAALRQVEADVVLPDVSTTRIVAHVRAGHDKGHFSYEITWSGGKTDIQELGWAFAMPKSCDHFSWHRKAYWSWYPENHIGRPEGTATPDSADVDVTKITRPDAFDFSSTKYNCDWAVLATKGGRGLGVVFAPDARHHCRAGTGDDGNHMLIVNKQCSPPQDISSPLVKDFYLQFKQGSRAVGQFMIGATGR